jgi:hypothetical protein
MGPIGGILADRFNRKTILLMSDFARTFLALPGYAILAIWVAPAF